MKIGMFGSYTKEKLIEIVTSIGYTVIWVSGFILSILAIIFFFEGTLIERAASLLLFLNPFISYSFYFLLFVIVPLGFVKRTRLFSGLVLFFLSYLFGLQIWVYAAIVTYFLWGWIAIIIGVFLAGIGVVPVAILASVFSGEWTILVNLIFGLVSTLGSRFLGLYFIHKYDAESLDQAIVSSVESYRDNNEIQDAEVLSEAETQDTKKFCSTCGNMISLTGNFCKYCGSKI